MEMVLSILGTILMFILIAVLILLLLLAFILFMPICYKVSGEYQKELNASGRMTWLGAIVYFRFSYIAGKTDTIFRIFGVDVKKFLERRKRRKAKNSKRKKAKQSKKSVQTHVKSVHRKKIEEVSGTKTQECEVEPSKDKQQTESIQDISKTEQQEVITEDISGKTSEKKTKKESKIKKVVRNIRYRWNCIKKFFKSVLSFLKKNKRKAEWANEVKAFCQKDNTKTMVCILKDNVLHLWRKLKPKVLRGKIEFGTDDPCLTGEILGVAAIFYACYGDGVQVIPDFEKAKLEGNLFIKGRISLITIIMVLIRILLSKEWNQFKDDIDKLKEAL